MLKKRNENNKIRKQIDPSDRRYIIGERIQSLRESRKGLTQEKLAESLFRDEENPRGFNVIKNWEQHYNIPSGNDLFLLSNYFHCDIAYLVGEIEEKTISNHAQCNYFDITERTLNTIQSRFIAGVEYPKEVYDYLYQNYNFLELLDNIVSYVDESIIDDENAWTDELAKAFGDEQRNHINKALRYYDNNLKLSLLFNDIDNEKFIELYPGIDRQKDCDWDALASSKALFDEIVKKSKKGEI